MEQTEQEILYHFICSKIPLAVKSSMFGVSCYKVHRKPFIMFYDNEIVCKLFDDEHTNAMKLKGAKLFNPMDNGKPMTNWVHIPFAYKKEWIIFAQKAFDFVENETKYKK
jgi:hypothetical protein